MCPSFILLVNKSLTVYVYLTLKASDAKKFAGLLYKLVMKYPKVIKKIEDPMLGKYDDLLKQYQQQKTQEPKHDTKETSVEDDLDDDSDERMEL